MALPALRGENSALKNAGWAGLGWAGLGWAYLTALAAPLLICVQVCKVLAQPVGLLPAAHTGMPAPVGVSQRADYMCRGSQPAPCLLSLAFLLLVGREEQRSCTAPA